MDGDLDANLDGGAFLLANLSCAVSWRWALALLQSASCNQYHRNSIKKQKKEDCFSWQQQELCRFISAKGGRSAKAVSDIIDYVENPQKTETEN